MKRSEMSLMEKKVCTFLYETSPVLKYKISSHKGSDGCSYMFYEIPALTGEDIKATWPFANEVSPETVFYDLHSEKWFTLKDAKILRYAKRNILVSPFFLDSGGMVVDSMESENTNYQCMECNVSKTSSCLTTKQ